MQLSRLSLGTACDFGARLQADTALAEFLHEVKSASFVDYRRLTQILVRALVLKPFRTCARV